MERKSILKENNKKYQFNESLIQILEQTKQAKPETDGVFRVHGQEVTYDAMSLFLFDQNNKFRRAIVWLVKWPWFVNFIRVVIIFNSISIGVESKEHRIIADYE